MINNLIDFLKKELKLKVNNEDIYYEAFTHTTFANENNLSKNYQRLELLGDALIYSMTTEYIYKKFTDFNEGEMSIMRANFIKGDNLAQVAISLDIPKYIRLGKSKDLFKNKKIFEDVFEALVGAIYLDQGYQVVHNFLNKCLLLQIKNVDVKKTLKNPKTLLQEFLQSDSRETIYYKTEKKDAEFISKVYHDKNLFGKGSGKTKKEAEVNAAINALNRQGGNS